MPVTPPGPVPLTLLETATRIDRYRWAETRLFELTGAWSTATPDDELAASLGARSRHHGWHLELWAARRPLAAPAGEIPPDLDVAVATLAGIDHDGDRLAVLDVLVTELLDALDDHLARANPLADASLARTLRLVADELRAGLDEERTQRLDCYGAGSVSEADGDAATSLRRALDDAGGLVPTPGT